MPNFENFSVRMLASARDATANVPHNHTPRASWVEGSRSSFGAYQAPASSFPAARSEGSGTTHVLVHASARPSPRRPGPVRIIAYDRGPSARRRPPLASRAAALLESCSRSRRPSREASASAAASQCGTRRTRAKRLFRTDERIADHPALRRPDSRLRSVVHRRRATGSFGRRATGAPLMAIWARRSHDVHLGIGLAAAARLWARRRLRHEQTGRSACVWCVR